MTDSDIIITAKRIKQYRKRSGLTQAGLAEKSGVDKNTIARLERGKHRALLQTIEKLAKAFDVTVTDILGR
jgi:transcriptional regulator with XRE-family HTH domain